MTQLRVQYYNIDLELIFSRNPLISSGKEDFSFVRAFKEEARPVLAEDRVATLVWPIPQDLVKNNCYIVVHSDHRQAAITYFSSALKVAIDEELGQLRAVDPSDKPLSKVYVKVIAE